jgi:hypothetical protein
MRSRSLISVLLGTVLALAGGLSCGDSTGPVNSVTRFIATVTTLDESVSATLVRGAPPSAASGPSTSATPFTAINGGTSQVHLNAADSFTIVIVFVEGFPDYYRLDLPANVQTADLLLRMPQDLSGPSFSLVYELGQSVMGMGPRTTILTPIVHVGSGDIQVSLSWNAGSDVDLHLLEPGAGGEEIFYGHTSSGAGGTLDLDSNPGCAIDGIQNENITYPSTSLHGTYTVRVDYFDSCGATSTDYVVTIRVKGQSVLTFTGTLSGTGDQGGAGSGTTITTFSY